MHFAMGDSMARNDQRSDMDSDSEVWQAISAFEQILEVMPDDRSSLETLSHAYEHVGDRVRALEYLLRLAGVVLAEGDAETAGLVRERLLEYAETSDDVRVLLTQLEALSSTLPAPQGEGEEQGATALHSEAQDLAVFRVTDELAFAWKLFEAGEISQEDYSAVAHDLAELSIDPHLATVSVLHVLETRAFNGLERVMGYASRDTKTPLISLQAYEVNPEQAGVLPLAFMIRRGVVVFSAILDELLVAVMNPYDNHLREDVTRLTGRTCHFFLTLPSEFDALITLLKAAE